MLGLFHLQLYILLCNRYVASYSQVSRQVEGGFYPSSVRAVRTAFRFQIDRVIITRTYEIFPPKLFMGRKYCRGIVIIGIQLVPS